jgi:hypothetical protein
MSENTAYQVILMGRLLCKLPIYETVVKTPVDLSFWRFPVRRFYRRAEVVNDSPR